MQCASTKNVIRQMLSSRCYVSESEMDRDFFQRGTRESVQVDFSARTVLEYTRTSPLCTVDAMPSHSRASVQVLPLGCNHTQSLLSMAAVNDPRLGLKMDKSLKNGIMVASWNMKIFRRRAPLALTQARLVQ